MRGVHRDGCKTPRLTLCQGWGASTPIHDDTLPNTMHTWHSGKVDVSSPTFVPHHITSLALRAKDQPSTWSLIPYLAMPCCPVKSPPRVQWSGHLLFMQDAGSSFPAEPNFARSAEHVHLVRLVLRCSC